MSLINRVPSGFMTGGEFSAHNRNEADPGILDPANLRDVSIGSLLDGTDRFDLQRMAEDHTTFPPLIGAILIGRDVNLTERAAYNESLPEELFGYAFTHWSPSVRASAIANPSAPITGFRELQDDEEWEVQEAIAGSDRCPLDVLEKYSDHEDPAIRGVVGRNDRSRGPILEKLAKDPDAEVRASGAGNPFLSKESVLELSRDPERAVRLAIASRHDLADEVSTALAKDAEYAIRKRLSWTFNTSIEGLSFLMNDEDEQISSDARKALDQKMRLRSSDWN